jgi:hypothetical protein
MFPVAPTGGPVPPAVAEAKARRRRERKERNLKGVQNDKVRKERLENRKQLKEQVRGEGEDKLAEPQRIDDLTQLKIWLGRGLLKFYQVQNVSPGWILAYETGEGLAMTADEHRLYEQASQMGLMINNPPVWWQVGILKYPTAQQTLTSIGFDQFVNFFGKEEPRWAMEIPVAMELGLFASAWVHPFPLVDSDWDGGGAGPFLQGVSASMIDEGRVDPSAAAMNEEQQREAREYTALRLQRPGAAEADQMDVQYSPTVTPDVTPAAPTEKEMYQFYYVRGVPGPHLVVELRNFVKSIAAHAIANENGATDEQKIVAFLKRLRVHATGGVVLRSSPFEIEAERDLWKLFKQIDPASHMRAYDDFVVFDLMELVLKEGPPFGGWPQIAAPVAYDPPPAPGLSVAEVQQAAAEKQASRSPPTPQEYHTISDYMKTAKGRDLVGYFEREVIWSFDALVNEWLPPIAMREKFFFLRIPRLSKFFTPLTRADAFLSDNHNEIADPKIVLGTAYGNPSSFKMVDVFVQTVTPDGNEYSVPVDQPESFGMFGPKQMEHLYEHLFLKAKPLFSVSPDKAVQFFPSSFVCSNVWWWESKLEKLPLGTTWHQIGKGGYNYAYRLKVNSFSPGEAAQAFLPPSSAAYGTTAWEEALPSMMQHGLVKRVAWAGEGNTTNITGCMRELYLAGHAASCGVGPKILVAYIQPGGSAGRAGHVPSIEMNPGDPEERFANPLYEPKHVSKSEVTWNEADAPLDGWYLERKTWAKTVEERNLSGNQAVLQNSYLPSYNLVANNVVANNVGRDPRTYDWLKMVVVMESYEGDMGHFKWPRGKLQRKKTVEALMKTFYKMGEAGILHCDMKAPNMVYRTWSDKGKSGWSNIETMAIDFDPQFVKVVPWLPGPVIALINAACFFAWDVCFSKGRFQEYTMEPLKELHKEVMDKYPKGVAEAFRALVMFDGPGENPFKRDPTQPWWLADLFNDEYETAETFFHWFRMYLNRNCSAWKWFVDRAPPNASILARLLAMAQHGDPRRALDPPNPEEKGNFPFELHPDPLVRMQMAARASTGVWGGLAFDTPETGCGWESGSESGSGSESESDGGSPEEE